MNSRWIVIAAALPLAACAAVGTPTESTPAAPSEAMACNADAVQSHIGHKATAAAGPTLLQESGARTLRWAPPRSAMTMDYRPDRLTVGYDDAYIITQISCG
jgi:hypothetical protein